MRLPLIAFVAAICLAGSPAAAQEWKEYAYPDYAFTVSFPAEPTVETTTYEAADGSMAPAHVYSVTEGGDTFKVTVVDLSHTAPDEKAVIDHAVKVLSRGGEVKVDIPHRVRRVYGRQLSILGADGSHSTVAVFYYQQQLYQIEGTALPMATEGTGAAIRFQQSLVFTSDAFNRSADEIRADRRGACRGAGAGNAVAAPGAGTQLADNGRVPCRRGGRQRGLPAEPSAASPN
jgi:hypothetical protein